MMLYVMTCEFCDGGLFGVYSSMKKARVAFEEFLNTDEDVLCWKDIGHYKYKVTLGGNMETYDAEIITATLDE